MTGPIEANLRRIALASLIAPAVNLIHIIIFGLDLAKGDAVSHTWRLAIIASHSTLLLLFTVFGLTSWLLTRRGKGSGKAAVVLCHTFYVLLLFMGASIALVDQLVTPAITPFLVVSILVPLVAQLPPRGPPLYHAAAFFLLVVVLPVVQSDPNVRLSNLVNALTAVGAGVFLNLLLWHFHNDRTRQDERIEEQTRQLMEVSQTRDKFFSIIAHDLRSPFAGFMGILEALRDRDSQVTAAERAQALDLLHASSVSLYRLLENLLSWSKSQQNLIEVRPVTIDLVPFLELVREPFRGLAAEKRLTVDLMCPPGLTVVSDPQILETILRNLLSNALKFTPVGGRIHLAVAAIDETSLEFECRDTGVGIPEATLASLFAFDRPGGLGLILCRDFVGRLGGVLNVESQLGGPTRFWFRLART